MFLSFGFSQEWTRWVLALTSTAFFFILVNVFISTTFSSSIGIRQGDPLSPFLIIIMAEGLSRMLKDKISVGSLRGLSLHDDHHLSYQHYFDDNLLFWHPSVQEAHIINKKLYSFSVSSGTTINIDKSHIFFFNMDTITQCNAAHILGFSVSTLPYK